MPALDPHAPDVFHDAAGRIAALAFSGPDEPADVRAIADELGDVLEELSVRVISIALDGAVGDAPVDRVTLRPVKVWPVIADARTRLERLERHDEASATEIDALGEAVAELDRQVEAFGTAIGDHVRRIDVLEVRSRLVVDAFVDRLDRADAAETKLFETFDARLDELDQRVLNLARMLADLTGERE